MSDFLASEPADGPDADAVFQQAWTLVVEKRPAEAVEAYRTGLAIHPAHAPGWANLGAALTLLGRAEEAEGALRQALALDPSEPSALRNLGVLLRGQGRPDELALLATQSDRLETVLPAALPLRAVLASRADILAERGRFAAGLEGLAKRAGALRCDGEPFPPPQFLLAYHGLDDRPLMEELARVMRSLAPDLAYVSPNATPRRPDGRIRLAVVSDHLFNHTIGRLYLGLIAALDRSRFEVTVVHGPYVPHDAVREAVDAAAERSMTLSGALGARRAQIEAISPDIIFYPDLGMSGPSLLLAHARLAPVQVTAWGHPDTTGLPSIDYFLSTDAFEPPGAEAHYSERLVRLSRIPCVLTAPGTSAPPPPAPSPWPAAAWDALWLPADPLQVPS